MPDQQQIRQHTENHDQEYDTDAPRTHNREQIYVNSPPSHEFTQEECHLARIVFRSKQVPLPQTFHCYFDPMILIEVVSDTELGAAGFFHKTIQAFPKIKEINLNTLFYITS